MLPLQELQEFLSSLRRPHIRAGTRVAASLRDGLLHPLPCGLPIKSRWGVDVVSKYRDRRPDVVMSLSGRRLWI